LGELRGMTEAELTEEYDYRVAERLAILTDGQREPTEEERKLARKEGREWLMKWHEEHPE